MNGVRVEYEATVKQSSKGVWYCDGLRCGAQNFADLATHLDQAMLEIEAVLASHNQPEQPPDPKAD